MNIAILSTYSGREERGVENWASEIQSRITTHQIQIISGNYIFKIRKWINADIIIPTNGRLQILFATTVANIFRKKLIVFGHSGPGADDKWNLLCSPDVFVAFSDQQKKWAQKNNFWNTRIIKINHAVDTNKFKPAKNKPKNKVLCVAANVPYKRVDLVKKAVKKLKKIELIVYGSGQKNQASYEQMPKVYKDASVFCFVPESWEAFGLVYLEALATNLPVVTIDDLVRREIVGDAGILVSDPEDIDKLSKAIQKALDTNWENKPRTQAEKFSWENILPSYTKLFSNV